MQMASEKRCKRCGQTKPCTEFHADNGSKDGLFRYCKECWNQHCESRRRARGQKPLNALPRKGRAYDVPEGTKHCGHCKTIKPLSEFYSSRSGSQGRLNWCSACFKADQEQRRRVKGMPPRINTSGLKVCPLCGEKKPLSSFPKNQKRSRGVNPYCYVCWREYATEQEKKRDISSLRRKRNRVPSKQWLAASIVGHALKLGVLTRQPCSVCGTTELVQGHHADYMKPLEVTWLCRLHHFHVHGKLLDLK